jgi:hypothetical protein
MQFQTPAAEITAVDSLVNEQHFSLTPFGSALDNRRGSVLNLSD